MVIITVKISAPKWAEQHIQMFNHFVADVNLPLLP